jgi:hypothetical protein
MMLKKVGLSGLFISRSTSFALITQNIVGSARSVKGRESEALTPATWFSDISESTSGDPIALEYGFFEIKSTISFGVFTRHKPTA